ncbi:putative allophanate hydrolase subunit 2 (AHS2) [Neisseria animaloris]|uniref:5-oxoprolinase subunit C family protein n=1 Tax=Neisseria animaloris TaxID=326522 RepID=UPI000A190E79|nr:biotin-dependent carboxyltransferase family protein [Neisseria animaloris]OSI08843.1 hypothetical protein BWD08_01645 [Neisseria animaloris]VEH87188.1 putative allophanate hydrolase subunit 2 (AHS2) [Neisseria animaloris]
MMHVAAVQAMAHIQDLGRFDLHCRGISHAGAMDTLSLQAGNLLLGNDAGAAALEIALGGITVSFEYDTPFCITGAIYEAQLDDEPVYSYWRYTARRGQTLKLIRAVKGMYGYLCVHGGFDVPAVLGSRSTDLRSAFGGFEGRCLRAGDAVPVNCFGSKMNRIGIAPPTPSLRIHALPSSEYQAFARKAHYRLWQNAWTLQSNSNRMGYCFDGEELPLEQPLEILSHAVWFGTIQVPPNGKPIILMADAQTTGGYPKIATVAAADLGRLAQIRFGSKIFFQTATPEEAEALQHQNQIYLNKIKRIADEAR